MTEFEGQVLADLSVLKKPDEPVDGDWATGTADAARRPRGTA